MSVEKVEKGMMSMSLSVHQGWGCCGWRWEQDVWASSLAAPKDADGGLAAEGPSQQAHSFLSAWKVEAPISNNLH